CARGGRGLLPLQYGLDSW
nr:immunoglobulin heavy chain junction region [Macaca mulatta]MOV56223.1 immunoglobulin heavy chain junction region [Macaca mulatta]